MRSFKKVTERRVASPHWFQCGFDSGSRSNFTFYTNKIFKVPVVNRSSNMPMKVQKPLRKAGNQVSLLILVNFHATGSGSGSEFQIRIRIHDSQLMCGSGSTTHTAGKNEVNHGGASLGEKQRRETRREGPNSSCSQQLIKTYVYKMTKKSSTKKKSILGRHWWGAIYRSTCYTSTGIFLTHALKYQKKVLNHNLV